MNAVTSRVPGAPGHEGALGPSLSAVGSHRLLVSAVTLFTVLAALVWLQLRSSEYVASAQLLVTPLPQDDETLLGLQVVRDSGDPTRTVQTAATLIESREAAQATARSLGDGWGADEVLNAIEVKPEGESNILAVTATADSASEASQVANGFVRATLDERNRALSAQISAELERLRARQKAVTDSGADAAELASRVDQLESVDARGDPTLSLAQRAVTPSGPTGAGALVVLPIALLAGLALGSAAALLLELFDRRVRHEAELVALYPIPVLARVPRLFRGARQSGSQAGWHMPPVVYEAFRTILAQLGSSPEQARSLMVTSASTGEGKTTSAINLAASIAASGKSVILFDLDLRKPDVARYLEIEGAHPIHTLLTPNLTGRRFVRLLRSTPLVPNLRVLCTAGGVGSTADLAAFERAAARLLAEAMQHADFVVADTPPLGEVADALRFADAMDGTILVAWPRKTHLRNFEFARDLLERGGHTPLGYLLVGVQQGSSAGYYQSHSRVAAVADFWSHSTSRVRTRATGGRRQDRSS